ncbi:hypothetical protein FACS189450_15120 [Spirochaetia bacterium]|nr:hypothetical protein FACS189450_15120 [Spirochaetia bacterium]
MDYSIFGPLEADPAAWPPHYIVKLKERNNNRNKCIRAFIVLGPLEADPGGLAAALYCKT